MAEHQEGRVSELTIVNYSAMYMPISMVLLPFAVYVLPYYVELGISLYAMSRSSSPRACRMPLPIH